MSPPAPKTCPRCGGARSWRGQCPVCLLAGASACLEAPAGPPPATRLGAYELLEEIGSGGMGRVWRARQDGLAREVAVKTLRAGAGAGPLARERFRREALAVARLRHPGIVTVYEVGEAGGELFLSLELIQGGTLAQRLKQGPLSPRSAAELVRAVADGVQHAHDHGVIHRDLKPSNILLDAAHRDVPRLTDFGIALLADADGDSLTATLEGLGTIAYLAPEQASGRRDAQGPATDVYGLGAVLYHCLTGRAPFMGETPATVLRAIMEFDPPSPRLVNPMISRDLETICLKCLEKEPRRRYSSASELRDELDRLRRGETLHARPVSGPERLWRWSCRKPALALTSGVAFLALVLGMVATSWQWRRAERAAADSSAQLTMAWNVNAQTLFAANEPRDALAFLARTLRREPANRPATARLVAGLIQRRWPRPLFQLGNHPGYVLRTAWSPDGSTILTAGDDGVIRAWSAATGQRRTNTWTVTPGVNWLELNFSPDGRWIASLQEPGVIELWPAEGGPSTLRLGQSGAKVLAVRWHPDSTRLAVIRDDQMLELWSVATAYCERQWHHPSALRDLDFPRDGRWLVTASADGVARIFDVQTGQAAGPELRAGGPLRGARWHPQGTWLALTTDTNHTVEVWEWPGARRRFQQRHDAVAPACFTPGGLMLRFNAATKVVSAVRPTTGLDQFRIPQMKQVDLAWNFSPDGRFGLISADGLNLVPYAVNNGTALTEPIRVRWAAESAAFSPDGSRLVIAAGTNVATVWRLALPQSLAGRVKLPGEPLDLQFVPGDSFIRSCDPDGTIRDTSITGSSRSNRNLPIQNLAFARFSADAAMVAAVDSTGSSAVYDADSGRLQAGPWPLPEGATRVSFSPDGRWLGIGTTGERLALFDVRNAIQVALVELRLAASSPGLGSKVTGIEFNPASDRLVVCTYGGAVQVFAAADGELQLTLPHPTSVVAARFSRDGRMIATACLNGVVQIWDAKSGRPIGPPLVHEDSALDVRFAPQGDSIFTAGQDRSVRGWETASGRLLWRVNTTVDPLQLAVDATGTRVAAVTGGNGNRVWDARTGLSITEHLILPGAANRTLVAPGGQWIAFWWPGARAYLFPMYQLPVVQPPAWLPKLAEAIVGLRYGDNGDLQVVPTSERISLEARLANINEPDPFWARLLQECLEPAPMQSSLRPDTFGEAPLDDSESGYANPDDEVRLN